MFLTGQNREVPADAANAYLLFKQAVQKRKVQVAAGFTLSCFRSNVYVCSEIRFFSLVGCC